MSALSPLLWQPGRQTGSLQGPAGVLEVALDWAPNAHPTRVAVVAHPHPQHQGTMHNKVVTSAQRAYQALGMPVLRFNFRGVGRSQGTYGDLIGEQDDLATVLAWLAQHAPEAAWYLAGFSFGSYITAMEAPHWPQVVALLGIAPPVTYPHFPTQQVCRCDVVVAESDEVVDAQAIKAWYELLQSPEKHQHALAGASHFFHGRLNELKECIESCYR